MVEEFYPIPENPEYNADTIRKIQDTDPVRASTILNPLIEHLIENTAAVKKMTDGGYIHGDSMTAWIEQNCQPGPLSLNNILGNTIQDRKSVV